MKQLNVPFKSQRDNVDDPYQTCNVTCAAMCLMYFGHPGTIGGTQLEDVLNRAATRYGYNRYSPQGLKMLIERWSKERGLPVFDTFNEFSTIEYIKESIDAGHPLITHGYFTSKGHIIVIDGYDKNGCFVEDPYGEWFAKGYINSSGHNLHYSWGMLTRNCYEPADNSWWTHRIHK